MQLIKPSYHILTPINRQQILEKIEFFGRVCYKSEDKITPESSKQFIKQLIKNGHESVLEHENISIRFVIDRGVSHELVRHRLCAFSQESTRFCNYKTKGLVFIIPPWLDIQEGEYNYPEIIDLIKTSNYDASLWLNCIYNCEKTYLEMLEKDWTPQQARSILPNSLKTEIICTTNLREWRHMLKLRTSKKAHPQMREIMCPLCTELKEKCPPIFDDIAW